ncbi:MAG TPA: glycosyltransferase [Trueperaceae bacterium]|nr:glycosyltransferase [Trueperaceae bacterium]
MRILYVTSELPYPPDRGAAVRGYHLLRWLAPANEIVMLSLTEKRGQELDDAIAGLSELCRRIRAFPSRDLGALEEPFRAMRFAMSGVPIDLRRFASSELAAAVEAEIAAGEPDVVALEHSSMMLYLSHVPESLRARTVLLSHDVDFLKYWRLAQLESALARRMRLRLHAAMLRRWEPRMAERFGLFTTVSAPDRDALLALNPRVTVAVVPNGVDVAGLAQLPAASPVQPARLLFIGNLGYGPNIDAVAWLTRDIVPRIQQRGYDVEVDVIGVGATDEVRRLASDSVRVLGSVPDVRPSYEAAAVSLVPLRAGGGTRLKILEAMALGRPVVTTSIGCEGLEVEHGKHVLVADDTETFATSTIELLTNAGLRNRLVHAARELVERRYDWRTIGADLVRLLTELSNADRGVPARA